MSTAIWDTVWPSDSLPTRGDWRISDGTEPDNAGGFAALDPFNTAILLALYSDAMLPDYMVGTYGFTAADQFQWHGNTFGVESDEAELGSLLWTLERAPITELTGKQAVHFAAEALQVLVKNHWCTGFLIDYELVKMQGRITLTIVPLGIPERRVYYADLFPLQ